MYIYRFTNSFDTLGKHYEIKNTPSIVLKYRKSAIQRGQATALVCKTDGFNSAGHLGNYTVPVEITAPCDIFD